MDEEHPKQSRPPAQPPAVPHGPAGPNVDPRVVPPPLRALAPSSQPLEPGQRYEIVDTIAAGEFATVYRARDRELRREVAIKQIHRQFLDDPRQLERYWREAQLLASLQHPNILTIYDIVRPKGWLILELMRGSLQRTAQVAPIDLDLLRVVLLNCLNALQFLHSNGIIHGDVKPSNMLVDVQGRVKLGDFGLARRASNEQGSLLKGTTKYMAPELVSDQFGSVGPASDLYALGFSAYELMCGPHFESLFPGLGSFGRDRQIAWLMWHAAADRHLPEIGRVLEGVPEDLAQVVQRLVAKDQALRYQEAAAALADLRAGHAPGTASPEPAAEAPPPDKEKKLIRFGAIAAMLFSILLSAWILFRDAAPPAPPDAGLVQGTVRSVDPDRRILIFESDRGDPVELTLKPDDRFFVNEKKSLFRELQPADQVAVRVLRDPSGRRVTEVHATRPLVDEGRIQALDLAARQLTLVREPSRDTVVIRVADAARLRLNGQETLDGKPVQLADLRPGDRASVRHLADQDLRAATEIFAQREIEIQGVVRAVDMAKGELTLEHGPPDKTRLLVLPLAPSVAVLLNGRNRLENRDLTPADLKPGDKATVTHVARIVRIDAVRIHAQTGVVRAVHAGALEIAPEGQPNPANTVQETPEGLPQPRNGEPATGAGSRSYVVDAQCKITLGGQAVALEDLRAGDVVDVTHDAPAPDAPNARALSIVARRPANSTYWAILIGIQDYDDAAFRSPFAAEDARLLHDTLVNRMAVPPQQTLLLANEGQARLQEAIANVLQRVQASDAILVYFRGRALRDAQGNVALAARDFNRQQPAQTGLSLQRLVDQLEACPAKEKLLLLDTSPAVESVDSRSEPSSAELFQSLRGPVGRAALRTVTGIAASSVGQRSQVASDGKHGRFALGLAEGLSGRADKNRDNRLEPTELFAFVTEAMKASGASLPQTPAIFLPDSSPPRFSDEARTALRELAVFAQQSYPKLSDAKVRYSAAQSLAEKEVEPKLVYGLILMRARQRAEAERQFEDVRLEHPELLLPRQALAFLQFEGRDYADGLRRLAELVRALPPVKQASDAQPAEAESILRWAGQLRLFAVEADERALLLPELFQQLDRAVAARGPHAVEIYEQGQERARGMLRDLVIRIETAPDETTKSRLRVERRLPASAAPFPFDESLRAVLESANR